MGIIRDHPELALFLSLAAGYLLGKLRVGPITLGGICGTLIVSLLLGTQHVSVDDDVRSVFFALFIEVLLRGYPRVSARGEDEAPPEQGRESRSRPQDGSAHASNRWRFGTSWGGSI